jgi:phospholipid/cholesterol/gamma-HCH transport system substrate-binding protein
MRELIESFDKKSGQVLADARKMLGEVSASINNTKPAAPPRRR